MDCKTARMLLDLARPQSAELHAAEADALDGHLGGCAECDALFRQERLTDAHLSRAVREVPVPTGLRERLLDRLATERRRAVQRIAFRGGLIAAAAAVVLAVGTWSLRPLIWSGPVVLSPEALGAEVEEQARVANAAGAEWHFLQTHNHDAPAPLDIDGKPLNYALLAACDLVSLQGRPAPMLLFVNGKQQMRVYILSRDKFDLSAFPPGQMTLSLNLKLMVRPSADGRFNYVIIYNDGPDGLKPFLSSDGVPAG